MATIDHYKEQETAPTPLFLFDCALGNGVTESWSSHQVTVAGTPYAARLLQHNLFVLQSSADDGLDGPQQIAVKLANADSHFSQIERETGFKGARLTIQFLFYDLTANAPVSEARVIYRGVANPAQEITESIFRLSFSNRLNLQRVVLPDVRIQRRCPWMFPSDATQRTEALAGGTSGKYSALYRCGYSVDQTGGVGNLNGSVPFTSCDFTRAACISRGMFDKDASNQITRRFGGVEFVPPQIQVRGYGEKGTHLSSLIDNQARYNDFVPLVYGTAWYKPPIVFARNDGNLTHFEVLLAMGEIDSIIKVVANGVEIPLGQSGANMTATGYYNLITPGTRNGAFNLDFVDSAGNPLGDPYGTMAVMSLVVPNQVSNGTSLPTVEVLLNGLKLERFDSSGASLGETFTNNPVWVLLDVLRRSGWLTSEIDLTSFASSAAYCDAAISATNLYGNAVTIPRFQCNLVIDNRRSAAEVVKGIRNGSSLLLRYTSGGLLKVAVENTFAIQQPAAPDGTNSTVELNSGWAAYEFGDGTAGTTGILRKSNGDPATRLWSRSGAETSNRLTVEFQDEFNEYQQDSLALVDVDDSLLTASEISASFAGLGLPNFDQAARMLRLQLNKAIQGYTFIDFETTVRGVGLSPGDLIAVTYLKEGLTRQPFRVVKLSPSQNYQSVSITAQWHDDAWYNLSGSEATGGRSPGGANPGLPRPLIGSVIDAHGLDQFGITETVIQGANGSAVDLSVAFVPPPVPTASSAAIPLLSLSSLIASTGGTLAGGQNLYYAVTANDGTGGVSGLSFVVRATIPSGTNTNEVTLNNLSFSPGTATFNVYRGSNPSQLLEIASSVTLAASFVDNGLANLLIGPPDANYDHANVYWRREQQPEVAADTFSSTTIGNSTLGMTVNNFAGAVIVITRGTGARQERTVVSNTATTLTLTPAWTLIPDTSSVFAITDSGWNFGAVGATSPVQIQVPNWGGQTVQISGRSANAQDQESQYELNPLTRWQIGSSGVMGVDRDVPPLPLFGLNIAGQGSVDLVGISFATLVDTHTINAGTLTMYFWDELIATAPPLLVSGISTTDTVITLSTATTAAVNDFIQLDAELVIVTALAGGGTVVSIARGALGSTITSHLLGAEAYLLGRVITTVPFVPGFFGSPSSGSYSHSMYLPDIRIAAAQFYVTNVNGNSTVAQDWFGGSPDVGLRTHSGGQVTLQVDGYLAIQTNATPPFTQESTHAARNITATVSEAPSGGPIELTVRQGGTTYCTLTIADGATVSGTIPGFGLPPLAAGSLISLDITSVPSAAGTLPGKDLTVSIRF